MKVTLKYNLSSYSGTLNDMTYGSYKDGAVCIGRKWVQPATTPQQGELGKIAINLSDIYSEASAEWKADLKIYARKYGMEITPKNQLGPSGYALYVKMMYAWAASDPEHVTLDSLSLTDIQTLEAPVLSIADAVAEELLPPHLKLRRPDRRNVKRSAKMSSKNLELMTKELAAFINKIVNIPYLSEQEEQLLYELILLKALQLVLGELEA
jgi:hypothetical protein